MTWWLWLEWGAIYLVIAIALVAGLAASYGRELEAQRRPDRSWWIRRLLVLPVLAITATAATNAFGLGPSAAAFTAAMLSLGGYDALCLIETKWKRTHDSVDLPSQEPLERISAGSVDAPPSKKR